MSIVMNMFWDGVTPEQYTAAETEVGWRRDPAAGGRYHVAWFAGGGLRVVDVWDNAEAFDSFVQNRLMPGVAKVGIAGEPVVAIWPLHDLQIEGEPTAGCIVADGTGGGIPLEAYQELERRLDWKTSPPDGAVVHIVALDDGIVRDIGVWRSEATIEAFVSGPVTETLRAMRNDEPLPVEPSSPLHTWFDPTKVKAHS